MHLFEFGAFVRFPAHFRSPSFSFNTLWLLCPLVKPPSLNLLLECNASRVYMHERDFSGRCRSAPFGAQCRTFIIIIIIILILSTKNIYVWQQSALLFTFELARFSCFTSRLVRITLHSSTIGLKWHFRGFQNGPFFGCGARQSTAAPSSRTAEVVHLSR